MPFSMRWIRYALAPLAVLAVVTLAGCGDDDDAPADGSGTPSASESAPASATTPPNPVVPPMEGPDRQGGVTEETDFRADPAWRAPAPDDVPAADDPADPVLNPPADPECPAEWTLIQRPVEGFQICHPADWTVAGHGYVSSANEAQWYSVGIFDFLDETQAQQRAHVSIYVIPQFAQPFRYTLDCEAPLSLTFGGEPAVVCPDFPAESPEARIISYHAFREDLDYFVQVVPYFEYDADSDSYTDELNQEAFDLALQIAHTFEFTPIAR